MRCLFCKQDSSSAKSIEHIIPESMGNTKLILPLDIFVINVIIFLQEKSKNPLWI